MCLKIFVYGCVALWFLGFLKFLPDDIANKIVNGLLGKVLPGYEIVLKENGMLDILLWVAVGAFIGWNFPQPFWAKMMQEKIQAMIAKK